MAWVTSGSSSFNNDYNYPDGLPSTSNYKKRIYHFSINCDNNSCLYVKKSKPDSKNIIHYTVFCVKRKTGEKYNGIRNGVLTEEFYEREPIITVFPLSAFLTFSSFDFFSAFAGTSFFLSDEFSFCVTSVC